MTPTASDKTKKTKPGMMVKKEFKKAVLGYNSFQDGEILQLKKESLMDIIKYLYKEKEFDFKHLSFVTAIDNFPDEPRFDIVYQLYSLSNKNNLRLKVSIAEGETVPSVTSIWPGANWHERETYDLFGIDFSGHPQMDRLMMEEETEGHPLRKDYPLFDEDE